MGISMINICIGYEKNQSVAFHVLCDSIIKRSSLPVRICPVNLGNLKSIFNRPIDPQQSTEFAFSRFISNVLFPGEWVIYMDCDMLCMTDIAKLWNLRDENKHVMIVQHSSRDWTKNGTLFTKFKNQRQYNYPCKNWSSLMLLNGTHYTINSLRYTMLQDAESQSGEFLHQFKWVKPDKLGTLPPEWNYLVGYDNSIDITPSIIHYTLGGPWFEEFKNCEFAHEWHNEYKDMLQL